MTPADPSAAPTCLVVDDNRLNTGLAGHMLQRLGWRSVAVSDGVEALREVAARRFDLVLLDLRMPGLGGEEVCRRIREDLGERRLPVVAYTAHGMPEERQRMLEAGFSGLLIKPISMEDLRAVCDEALAARAAGSADLATGAAR
ncbi:response regulator [Piscinibacter sakaiensis]|uniref:Sensory box sensor histidine kinase/response regulator n=1 Tax=Piscinibacter sakaiensis TaxID=1547922 RepID=A0A0K8P5S6_PISS1|nr:response regulator [Piscinibacter sakaiensis]GAP38073.1 sensory box sensor histidine kinase/response regulator [Piscinibacter sakaiensis]